MPLMVTEPLTRAVAAKGALKESGPTLAEAARVGVLRVRQEILAGGIPLALQSAVRKWVRTGILVQVVDPSNLKQY